MTKRRANAFAFTEDELSEDARAILLYARKWGEPFTRTEVVEVAPGAGWDLTSPFPRTVAKPDPIRELIRAGLVEVAEERRSTGGRRGGHAYKVYRLTGDAPRSLEGLLDARDDLMMMGEHDEAEDVRLEILTRFGKP